MNTEVKLLVDKKELLEDIGLLFQKTLERHNLKTRPKYVSPKTAMSILNVKVSKLQQLRNDAEIVYTRTSSRGFMYLYQSLIDYMDKNVVQ